MVLANPPVEFARVAQYLLPQEVLEGGAAGNVTNVQALYLMAMREVNTEAQKVIESVADNPQGANGVQPPVSDW
jgi:hypothetical protein